MAIVLAFPAFPNEAALTGRMLTPARWVWFVRFLAPFSRWCLGLPGALGAQAERQLESRKA
jgi:hypothetical protein